MPKYHLCEQRTDEWRMLRHGKPTASLFHCIVTKNGRASGKFVQGKFTWSKQAKKYMYRLIAEKLMGEVYEDKFASYWVEQGIINEPKALAKFQHDHKLILQKVGFVTGPEDGDDARLGCSPDAYVPGSVEAVEIKCKSPWEHVGYLAEGPGEDYKQQVQGQMYVGEWNFVHFYAYHPNMPDVYRVTHRDDVFINKMKDALDRFLDDFDATLQDVQSKGEFLPP